MSSSPSDPATVLLVDDDERVIDAYSQWLESRYDLRTAEGGEEALSAIDEEVDVVLLDRRMPGLSGDDVLSAIRERGYDAQVVMITAVDPDVDIVDMAFDDYLPKPIDPTDLVDTIEEQLRIATYDERLAELFAVANKKDVLEKTMAPDARRTSSEYRELEGRLEALVDEIDDLVEDIDPIKAYLGIDSRQSA